eukprot:TRINITY_DN49908_c0_g1_i1.p2 TRINITY_DN49908_c0_g1~~TRINITY_DN49908_c0_g1_i1.p2  ORF type:complete len:898 (+),score=453.64 TRINITY_DN49908_c0_g1_i1:119-2812(+)
MSMKPGDAGAKRPRTQVMTPPPEKSRLRPLPPSTPKPRMSLSGAAAAPGSPVPSFMRSSRPSTAGRAAKGGEEAVGATEFRTLRAENNRLKKQCETLSTNLQHATELRQENESASIEARKQLRLMQRQRLVEMRRQKREFQEKGLKDCAFSRSLRSCIDILAKITGTKHDGKDSFQAMKADLDSLSQQMSRTNTDLDTTVKQMEDVQNENFSLHERVVELEKELEKEKDHAKEAAKQSETAHQRLTDHAAGEAKELRRQGEELREQLSGMTKAKQEQAAHFEKEKAQSEQLIADLRIAASQKLAEAEELRAKVAKVTADTDALTQANAALRASAEARDTASKEQVEDLQRDLAEARRARDQLTRQLSDSENALQRKLKVAWQAAQEHTDSKVTELAAAQRDREEQLSQSLSEARKQHAEERARREQQTAELAAARKEVSDLQASLTNLTAALGASDKSLSAALDEAGALAEELKAARAQGDAAQQDTREQLKDVREKLSAAIRRTSELEAALQTAQSAADEQRAAGKQLEKAKGEVEKELQVAQAAAQRGAEELGAVRKRVQRLNVELSTAQRELLRAGEREEDLQKELRGAEDAARALQERVTGLEGAQQQAAAECSKREAAARAAELRADDLQQQVNTLQQEVQVLQDKMASSGKVPQWVTEKLEENRKQLSTARSDLLKVNADLCSKTDEHTVLQLRVESLEKERDGLSNDLQAAERSLCRATKELTQLKSKMANGETWAAGLKVDLEEFEKENLELRGERDDLQYKLQKAENMAQTYRTKLDRRSAEVVELKASIRDTKRLANKRIDECNVEIERLEALANDYCNRYNKAVGISAESPAPGSPVPASGMVPIDDEKEVGESGEVAAAAEGADPDSTEPAAKRLRKDEGDCATH